MDTRAEGVQVHDEVTLYALQRYVMAAAAAAAMSSPKLRLKACKVGHDRLTFFTNSHITSSP